MPFPCELFLLIREVHGEQSASFSSDFCCAQSDPVLTLVLFMLQFVEERGFGAYWEEDPSGNPSFYLELSLLIDCLE